MIKRILALLLCMTFILLCFSACGKSDEEMIKDTIKDFLKAYNAGDLDATIETFSYKQRIQFKSYIKLIDGLGLGVTLSTLFGISAGVLSDEDMLRVQIMDIEIDEDDESATVEVQAAFSTKVEEAEYEGTFDMVKEDDGWYIEDLDLSPINNK